MILDACRSLVKAEDRGETKLIKRSPDSGSRLLTGRRPPPGFVVMYSASFGEQALESLSPNDTGEIRCSPRCCARSCCARASRSIELGDRVKLMVRAIAQDFRSQQEPEIVENAPEAYDVMLIGSIGRERFRISQDKCAGDLADWNQIKALRKRELYERHRRRFDGCATAEAARREIAQLALRIGRSDRAAGGTAVRSANATATRRRSSTSRGRRKSPAYRWTELTRRLPLPRASKVAGGPFSKSPAILFNLGQACFTSTKSRRGATPRPLTATRSARALSRIRGTHTERGYVSALNNLAVHVQAWRRGGSERNPQMAAQPVESEEPNGPSAGDVQSRRPLSLRTGASNVSGARHTNSWQNPPRPGSSRPWSNSGTRW